MKRSLIQLIVISLLCVSCYSARIVTVSPYSGIGNGYSTTVTVPRTGTVSTTTQVYAANEDFSLQLDLQAVGAAFAQSSSVREFEYLLNNSAYMISNLDLNRDGYLDYLRVMENYVGTTHLFVVQAVLGADVYQDVATIVVENPHLASFRIELIGCPFIYGPSYYVRPVFYAHPPILAHLARFGYEVWRSPWYWGHYPSCYKRPAPVYQSHYQAYVGRFMEGNRYCHEVNYPRSCSYSDYSNASRGIQRNDYEQQHPERSFTVRNAERAGANSAVQRAASAASREVSAEPYNARALRAETDATKQTSVSNSKDVSRQAASSGTSGTERTSRSASTSTSDATYRSSGSGVLGSGYGVSGSNNGTSGSGSRSSSYGTSGSGSYSSSRSGSVNGNYSRSGSSNGNETTVRSRVGQSGSSSTSISTRTSSGTTSTVNRNNGGSRSSASASSSARSSSSSSRSTATSSSRSSGSSSRTSGSSSSSSGSSSSSSGSSSTSRSSGTSGGSSRR